MFYYACVRYYPSRKSPIASIVGCCVFPCLISPLNTEKLLKKFKCHDVRKISPEFWETLVVNGVARV